MEGVPLGAGDGETLGEALGALEEGKDGAMTQSLKGGAIEGAVLGADDGAEDGASEGARVDGALTEILGAGDGGLAGSSADDRNIIG